MNMQLKSRLKIRTTELIPIYIAFLIILAINASLDKAFFTADRLAVQLMAFSPLICASIAQSIILITGGVDLSMGNRVACMGCLAAIVMTDSPFGIVGALLLVLVVGALTGMLNGIIVTFGKLPAIIVTLAMSFFWHGVALFLLPSPGGYISPTYTHWINSGSKTWAGLVFIAVAVALWKFIKSTKLGVRIYAIGDNLAAAKANGMHVNRVRILAYLVSGIFSGLAGIAFVGITGTGDANAGTFYNINSVAASVLGGVAFSGGQGFMRGTIIGAIIVQALINILFYSGLDTSYQYVLQGVILIAAVSINILQQYRRKRVSQ